MVGAQKQLPAPAKPRDRKPRAKETKKRAPGGGRKPGSKTRLSVELAQDAALAGDTPVDIMLHHARYAHQRAKTLADNFAEQVLALAGLQPDEVQKGMQDAKEVMVNMMAFSENACRYASLAAPYCHSRLNSISVDDKSKNTIPEMVEGKAMTQEEIAEHYRRLIK